jgi:hypothetical protein
VRHFLLLNRPENLMFCKANVLPFALPSAVTELLITSKSKQNIPGGGTHGTHWGDGVGAGSNLLDLAL